jgi:hypothetical protein
MRVEKLPGKLAQDAFDPAAFLRVFGFSCALPTGLSRTRNSLPVLK